MSMKVAADDKETEEMLLEGMELLADTGRNPAMFRQQYDKLKDRFDRHRALCSESGKVLNMMDTVQDNGEKVC